MGKPATKPAPQAPVARVLRPQAGPQEMFLASPADVVLFGGAAGGGKTFGLLLEPLRHIHNPGFGAVCFRRETKQVVAEGGLWDTAMELYEGMGVKINLTDHSVTWPSGAKLAFDHLQLEKDKYNWQGSQISLEMFDELTHFSKTQFQYLVSRNRTTCGVKPYVRATCNPDPDSWVRELVDWWIGPDGLPIRERIGVLRWYTVVRGEWVWADSAEELKRKTGTNNNLSFTFIPAKLEDNPALMEADPNYESKLAALEEHEQQRLRWGNWNARPSGKLYSRSMFKVLDAAPADMTRLGRGWDWAATEQQPGRDPDATASIKQGLLPDGRVVVLDMTEEHLGPDEVESFYLATTHADGPACCLSIPQDPGSAGKIVASRFVRLASGYDVTATPETGSKIERGRPFLAQAKAGNVLVLKGPWNTRFFNAMEAFGVPGAHDDIPDACHRIYNHLTTGLEPDISFI